LTGSGAAPAALLNPNEVLDSLPALHEYFAFRVYAENS
jgi:hypothetical protein